MMPSDACYIDGAWTAAAGEAQTMPVIDPVSEAETGRLALGGPADVDRAVAAAKRAFASWSGTDVAERAAVLGRIANIYQQRLDELADAIRLDIGAPLWLCRKLQAPAGLAHLSATVAALRDFPFTTQQGSTDVVRDPVGVAALITPWNWPLNQIVAKVAPALAAGCTVVLKPSEMAPRSARLFAEIVAQAEVPPGVFNMLYGDGQTVGRALASHADVDMVSITGSTRAGIDVALHAAPGIKRVAQELGGKSPNLILDDADLRTAVSQGVIGCMMNSGQTCTAPTRMLVPRARYAEAQAIAAATARALRVGDPLDAETRLGPLAHRAQYERVQTMIARGIDEGATLIAGGPGRPEGIERGFFARPTVFADCRNDMAIAREEIFGPVLAMIAYDGEEEGIALANDTEYGLASYVWSGDPARARRVAARLRAGSVQINGAELDMSAPFGGCKASGNGREFGAYGLAEFVEYKSVMGVAR